MPSTRTIAALALVVGLLSAGCSEVLDTGADPAFEETGLASMETVETVCGSPRSSNTSSFSRPVPGGRKLSINTTIPIRSNATELDADFEEIGPNRYRLDVERTGGSGVPDCYLETRFNATVNLTDDVTDDYTILVTYDGVLVSGYFADADSSGAASGLAPESRYAPWVHNVTGTGDSGSGSSSEGGAEAGSSGGGPG